MNTKIDRKEDVRKMLQSLLDSGVRYRELTRAIGCSRWAITLWVDGEHYPKESTYNAIRRAYATFGVDRLPSLPTMISAIERSGKSVAKALRCSEATLQSWRGATHAPQARYRAKIVKMYHEARRAA